MEPGRLLACRAKRLVNVALPVFLKQFRMLGWLDVQRDYFGRKAGRKFNSLSRDDAPAVDRNDSYRWLTGICGIDGILAVGVHPHEVVVAADSDEEKNRQRNEKQRNPCPLSEFRNQHYDHRDARHERTKPIHE